MNDRLRLIHLSDVHVWRLTANPLDLLNKRMVGMASLLCGRARKFRLERLDDVVARIRALGADHILITGDLTTTALAGEFEDALRGLGGLLERPERVTVVPGNHDRYTRQAQRGRLFERYFGDFMPEPGFPWARRLDEKTVVLGLDATRPHLSARGYLPASQMARATELLSGLEGSVERLVIACHYPAAAPGEFAGELARKRLTNQEEARRWLGTLPPHVFCCGHVHAAWAYAPPEIPRELCLNAGAPLLRDRQGLRRPGFLEVTLEGGSVWAVHHAWDGHEWTAVTLVADYPLFAI